jgi:rfaE bifunctional protein kinase chain/domain
LDPAHLVALIDALDGRAVAVIGDVVADEFVYGRVARVSREAPVLILEYDSTQVVAGAGGNAANNVAALGGRAGLVSIIGRDESGRRLLDSLHPRVDARGVLRPGGQQTTVKTRILAGGIHSAKQQVVRIDRVVGRGIDRQTRASFERTALAASLDADAVLMSDYGSGLVTPRLAARVQSALRRAGHPIPVLIDTRYQLLQYQGLTACTPNESEVEQALGIRIGDDPGMLERAGRAILERTAMQAVLITRGGRGMALFQAETPTVHIPIHGTDEIADVTGAGDTVMATMALALAAGAGFEAAARLANYAGGLVVMKRGTATIAAAELREAVQAIAQRSARGTRAVRQAVRQADSRTVRLKADSTYVESGFSRTKAKASAESARRTRAAKAPA